MTLLDEMKEEPWRFDFFHRDAPARARPSATGRASATARPAAKNMSQLGQDPYLDFPPPTCSRVDRRRTAGCRYSSSFSDCSGRRARCRLPRPRKP